MAERGALERAPVRAQLVRLLAADEHSHAELGKRYGVTRQSVREFAQRHAVRIAEARERIEDQFAGIVYADKVARVAELSEQVEYIADLLAIDERMEAEEDRARKAGVNVSTAELMRTAQTALRNISEELGQLPNRQTLQHEGGVSVRYEVVGVNTGDLT